MIGIQSTRLLDKIHNRGGGGGSEWPFYVKSTFGESCKNVDLAKTGDIVIN